MGCSPSPPSGPGGLGRSLARAAGAGLVACLMAFCQPAAGAEPRGLTATRAVSQYTVLEETLASLAAGGQRAPLRELLAEGFAYLSPELTDPLDAAGWLARVQGSRPAQVYAVQVLEGEGYDLVSCLVRTAGSSGTAQTRYVVDLWRSADHRLLSRHSARVLRAPAPRRRPDGRG